MCSRLFCCLHRYLLYIHSRSTLPRLARARLHKIHAYLNHRLPRIAHSYFSLVTSELIDNQRQLLVTGDGDQTEDQLYAWYRQITSTSKIDTATKKDTTITNSAQYYQFGAVNLASYQKIHVNLCLVSVNQADVPNAAYIQEELNKIYALVPLKLKI
jgi:hypothetical protein